MHRAAIEDPVEIRRILEQACDERILLTNGVNHQSAPRTARIQRVARDRVLLATRHIDDRKQPQIFLSFDLDALPYFFAATPLVGRGRRSLAVALPAAIYEAERRDLRRAVGRTASGPRRVELRGRRSTFTAEVTDWSYQGLAVSLGDDSADQLGTEFEVVFLDGERQGERSFGEVRHRTIGTGRSRVCLGLKVSQVPIREPVTVERRGAILEGNSPVQVWRRFALAGAVARGLPARIANRVRRETTRPTNVELIEYPNGAGGKLRAIVSRTGDVRGAPAVVIPPAWGKTKETLVALADTLVRTFERADEPLVVVRFDGTNRRGESSIDREQRAPGREYLGFTFSQAVRDIEATFDYLEASTDFQSSGFVLVSFSLGAVEARRAVALDKAKRVLGWISVVGMVDLQSGLRRVSGGVDYAYGLTRGVEFGHQELVGVVADMDHAGGDALEHGLVFAEDARRDMAKIDLPVTWIHGRYDAWMDIWRVRDLLSAGDSSKRRLIEVAAGHQMRSSREALETFQLIAQEAAKMALGRRVRPALIDLVAVEAAGRAERARVALPSVDLRRFWRDYLLGRDMRMGFELMTSTSSYRELMACQIERLALREGDTVVDLGAGTGELPALVANDPDCPGGLHLIQLDHVTEALARGMKRFDRGSFRGSEMTVTWVGADLELDGRKSLPLASRRADAVIASLVISYLARPEVLLQNVYDLLRPGGRLVLSSLRRDADISRIYVDSIAELPPDRVREHFGVEASRDFDLLQRRFLNDAARLMQFEEVGLFRFWDAGELSEMVKKAGFQNVRSERAFGTPPQAVVVSAERV
jgi:ubiquinone/menaquinone biosynthesis C-methylase UbiE/dienelactone hydrolase